jgi:acetyl esterase/lipase
MERAIVAKDLRYTDAPGDHLRMDVYRPPGLAADERRPVVVFVHGAGPPGVPMKEMGAFTSMGRLVTTLGFVGVTFTHRLGWPVTRLDEGGGDVAAALAKVEAETTALNVDWDRRAVWAYSGGGPALTPHLADAAEGLRAIVGFYPMLDPEGSAIHRASETPETLARWSPLRALAAPGHKAPTFLARAGADAIPDLLPGLDRFVAEALARDHPLTLMNHPGAAHGFDIGDAAPRTVEILEAALAFLETHLRA